MRFDFTISVEVERVEGKFASRDEIEELILEDLQSTVDGISLSGLGADGTSEYEVVDSFVEVDDPKKK